MPRRKSLLGANVFSCPEHGLASPLLGSRLGLSGKSFQTFIAPFLLMVYFYWLPFIYDMWYWYSTYCGGVFNKEIEVKVCPHKDMRSTAACRSGRHGEGGLGVVGAGEMGRGGHLILEGGF